MADKAEVPVLGMMQIGKATLDQRANKVQSKRRPFVTAQQELRINGALRVSKPRGVDDAPAVSWQSNAVTGFGFARARLGILTGKSTNTDHSPPATIDQYETHLQQDLELVGNDRRFAIIQTFAAVASLQKKTL